MGKWPHMLGWNIGVYRLKDGGASPATAKSPDGTRLAVWQTGVCGLDWINKLVKEGKAIDLGGNGSRADIPQPPNTSSRRLSKSRRKQSKCGYVVRTTSLLTNGKVRQ